MLHFNACQFLGEVARVFKGDILFHAGGDKGHAVIVTGILVLLLLLYLRPHGVVAGGILFYCRSFFLSYFFFFRQRIFEMALPTGNLYSSEGRI